jgi:hypothetical protein
MKPSGIACNSPMKKIYNNIQEYGNTTSATIPIALDEVLEKGMLKSGDNVMFIGLGAGLTWGGVLYRCLEMAEDPRSRGAKDSRVLILKNPFAAVSAPKILNSESNTISVCHSSSDTEPRTLFRDYISRSGIQSLKDVIFDNDCESKGSQSASSPISA